MVDQIGVVVDGHMRVAAAMQLELIALPVVNLGTTPDEIRIVEALAGWSFVPGSSQKRFVRHIAGRDRSKPLSEPQRKYLWAIAWSGGGNCPRRWRASRGPRAAAWESAVSRSTQRGYRCLGDLRWCLA